VTIRVESVPDHGMATIWDADILIWAASQIVEARDAGLRTSRLMAATPYEILRFIGRGTSLRDYQRLKAALDRLQSTTVCTSIRQAALDRLQSTTVATSIRQPAEGRRHRFSWINEWKERTDRNGRPDGIEMILPDWFYQAVLDDALILTIDRAYFNLAGGLERWLYRIVRKHGGSQRKGWRFDFRHLHQKSGALSPFKRFAFELRDIIRRQPLPGYRLFLEVEIGGRTLLAFEPFPPCGKPVDGLVPSGTPRPVLSGTALSCQQEPKRGVTPYAKTKNPALNLESNTESNFEERQRDVEKLIAKAGAALRSGAHKGKLTPPKQGSPASTSTPELPLGKPGGRR
jgi:plasmid replication initiation protein